MVKKKVCPKQSKPGCGMPEQKMQNNPIITDPQGCYTGRPLEIWETPVQDADDL